MGDITNKVQIPIHCGTRGTRREARHTTTMTEHSESVVDGSDESSTEPRRGAQKGAAESKHDADDDPTRETAADSESSSAELPLDQIFEILKNQRRRHVLQHLYETEGSVSLSDLAERIAAWENDKEVRQISSRERKRVYVGLYQCHLPKMDGMDAVSFNKPRGIIEPGANIDCFKPYLEIDDEPDEPAYNPLYVGGAVFGISLLPVTIWLRTASMPILFATVLAVALLTVGAAHHLIQ